MKLLHLISALGLMFVLQGCSWFGGDDEPDEVKPNKLTSINTEVRIGVVWSKKIGKGAGDRAIKLRPAIEGGRVFAAAADGKVKALHADSGRAIWEVQVKNFYTKAELANAFTKNLDTITGGVGVGGDLVVVGTASGEVVAMNKSDGSLAWKATASSEVLAPPQIQDDTVVVQSIDGKVVAYDAIDGSRKWLYTTSIPPLTLRGTSTPIIQENLVVAAFANGRVAFLDMERGLAGYDQRIAVAQGSSDLERLIDIDGAMQLIDNRLYVVGYQGRLVAIELASGGLIWSEEISSVVGLGSGFSNVYVSRADSQLSAFNADNGRSVWNVDALLHRDVTTPVTVGSYVAVTDFEGYVHLLAQSDGRFVGRKKIDGSGIKAGLVVDGGRLYAMGDGGNLSVLEIR